MLMNRNYLRQIIFSFFIVLFCKQLHAQDNTLDSLTGKMHYYSLQHPSATLFVHFDKTIYTNNETVWFTGYMLKGNPIEVYDAMSVVLVNNIDSTIAIEEKFVMFAGLSFGSLLLPDSLPPGNYSLMAYTNRLLNGLPEDIFIQPVTIKSSDDPSFNVTLKLDDAPHSPDSVTVALKAITFGDRLLTNADVQYTIGKGKNILTTGKTKTNVFGESLLKIATKQLNADNNLLQVQIKSGKESKKIRLQLPVYDSSPIVKFYPEGGSIIADMLCTVGFEVTTATGEPLPATAVLYEGDEISDTIQTDNTGMGRLKLLALKENNYTLQLLTNTAGNKRYRLPQALPSGPVMHIENALAGDSLYLKLMTLVTGPFYIVLHDYRQVHETFTLLVKQPASKNIALPLINIPKGIVAVTLMDSMGRPWVERLIFAHYNKRTGIQVKTDSLYYGTRQKVQISLRLEGYTDSIAGNGLVSVACVQENRLERKNMQDIESYFYLQHELSDMPYRYRPMGNDASDAAYLQNILLIKGWRRYTWQAMMQTEPKDTLQEHTSLQFTGQVTQYDKRLKKPVLLVTFHESSLNTFSTDSTGRFALTGENIITNLGKKVLLAVNNASRGDYNVVVTDPYKYINKKLSATIIGSRPELKYPAQDTRLTIIPVNERLPTLQTVVVTSSKRDKSLYAASKNACGDYVCPYNILNCPNHPFGGRLPVTGQSYNLPGGGTIVYSGCNEVPQENVINVKGIYMHKEFYGSDYAVFNPHDPEYYSTIFWKHAVPIRATKDVSFTFYTSDITGRFKIIVQGVSGNDVLYGEQTFMVRKKE